MFRLCLSHSQQTIQYLEQDYQSNLGRSQSFRKICRLKLSRLTWFLLEDYRNWQKMVTLLWLVFWLIVLVQSGKFELTSFLLLVTRNYLYQKTDRNCHFRIFADLRRNSAFTPNYNCFPSPNKLNSNSSLFKLSTLNWASLTANQGMSLPVCPISNDFEVLFCSV